MLNRSELIGYSKKFLYPNGEPYTFNSKKLRFVPGTRPIRRKYLNSSSDVVRNDVLQINFFERYFKSDDILWDIGSHNGHYSIFAASIAKGPKQVFSFEPDITAREVQQKNIKLNHLEDRIELFDFVLSNIKGTLRFKSMGGNANSHIIKNSQDNQPDIITLESTTIDSLLDELPEPTFVKIDTEGAEIDILKAATRLLEKREIRFICELHPFAWNNFNVRYEEFETILDKYNRKISLLDTQKDPSNLPYYGTVLF
jgi:FkbM family methyltransferase